MAGRLEREEPWATGLRVHPLSPKIGQGVTPKRKRIVNKVTALLRDNQGVRDPAGCPATRHMSGRGQR
jgi:hypothetical protein